MEALQQIAAILAVLALLAGTLWWLKRRGPAIAAPGGRNRARQLECVERVPLGPQQTLHLVRLADRLLLVASTPAGCSLLGELSRPDAARKEPAK